MKIIDIINGPWAITPEMLSEVRAIYATHLRGEKIDIAGIEARLGQPLKNKPQGYDVVNGSAVIPVHGVIAKKMNLFTQISGGCSSQMVQRDIRDALSDPSVQQIILSIDSPGGTVDGTFELAQFIYEQRGSKPIIAHTDGIMMSAAYAIGSAADKIYISGDTAMVGSIGVVATHQDVSKWEEKVGVKTTEIYAGKYKRIASEYAPLTEEGRASMYEMVDYLHTAFVDTVAKHRGTTSEDVRTRMSTDVKSFFVGKQSIEAGLVDGVATLDALINTKRTAGVAVVTSSKKTNVQEESTMDLATLKAEHPELVQAIHDEAFAAGVAQGKKDGMVDGAAAELERIKGVKAQSMPGHEATIEQLMFDGKSTGSDAALAIVAEEKRLRTKASDDYKEDGKIEVPVTEPGELHAKTMKRKDFNALTPNEQSAFCRDGGTVID